MVHAERNEQGVEDGKCAVWATGPCANVARLHIVSGIMVMRGKGTHHIKKLTQS